MSPNASNCLLGNDTMNFAIVTPSFNKARYLVRCLNSVLEQNYSNVDYWVLDNCSTDGSKDILDGFQKRYPQLLHVVIEPDNGQAEAINKGFSVAQGDIMGWLNADDSYLPGTFSRVESFFNQNPNVDLVYGRARILDGDFNYCGDYPVQTPNLSVLKSYDFIPQPTAFWRRRVWKGVGPLDNTLNWGLDWDFFIRAFCQYKAAFLDNYLVEVVCDGHHKTALGGLARTREFARIARRYGGRLNPTFLFCHYVLILHWLAAPMLRRQATAQKTQQWLQRLESYVMTFLYRFFRIHVMS